MTRYRIADCAIIHKTKQRFGELSNMKSNMPVEYDDRMFFSTEALYQCCRYPGMPNIQEEINVKNAMLAKMKSKPPRRHTRADWYGERVSSMEQCLRLKVEQHTAVMLAVLADTGDLPIVERSHNDIFWGAKLINEEELEGENVLGLLWMLIREELRLGTFTTEVSLSL